MGDVRWNAVSGEEADEFWVGAHVVTEAGLRGEVEQVIDRRTAIVRWADGTRSRFTSPGASAAPDGGSARQRVLDQIEVWRKELINPARSNRLLYFRHTKSSTLEIVREPDQIEEVVARILADRSWRFYVPPERRRNASGDLDGADEEPLFASEVPQVPAPDELITNKTAQCSGPCQKPQSSVF